VYPVNYGYVAGVTGGDGEEQDAYVIGLDVPLSTFTGRVVAIIHRENDVEDKLVVVPDGMQVTDEEIGRATFFQERWYTSRIIR